MRKKVVILGSGNVATHLSVALKKADYSIIQVYSRSELNAATLAKNLDCCFTTSINELNNSADYYIYALTDSVLADVINQVEIYSGIHLHTAGSVTIDVFRQKFKHFAVLYPLQTFSKQKEVDFSRVPLFIEASDDYTTNSVRYLAEKLSEKCYLANSEQRLKLHIAAVFACNFSNYFYNIAAGLLHESKIPFDVLKPLILETALKIQTLHPAEAQTGPARRNDITTMESHLNLLNDKVLHETYQSLSEQISKLYNDK